MKKNLLIVIFSFVLVFIHVLDVHAECEGCDITNCASCGCVINSKGDACVYSNYSSDEISCGDGLVSGIPSAVPKIVSTIYLIIEIAVPVILVIYGLLDLVKAVMANKEDEIKNAQNILIRRIVYAVVVFFIFALVKTIIGVVAKNDTSLNKAEKIVNCAECFIKNKCDN